MFRYEDFPEINKAHKNYHKLVNRYTKAHIKYDKSGAENASNKWGAGIQDAQTYRIEYYCKIVFDVFKAIKPDIKDKKEGTIYKWDELYGQDFEQLSPTLKKALSMMVEEERPFILPAKYYDDKPLY